MNALRFQAKELFLLLLLALAAAGASEGSVSGVVVAIVLSSLMAIAVLPQSSNYIVFGLDYKHWQRDALVKSVGFLAVYSCIFLLLQWWLGGNGYLSWLISMGIIIAITFIATRRFFFEKGRSRAFNQSNESTEGLFTNSRWLMHNAVRGVLFGSYVWLVASVIVLILLVVAVAMVDYLVHSASAFGAYLADLGTFITVFIVVGALMGNYTPREILGQWLLYGNNRKPWMWFTVVATAVYGLIITLLCMGLLQLTAYFGDRSEVEQFSYSIWLVCVIGFTIFPLREAVLSVTVKTYYPVVIVVICIIMIIVLGIAGIVTGLGQLFLAIAVYFLWAADFLHRAQSMAPKYADS